MRHVTYVGADSHRRRSFAAFAIGRRHRSRDRSKRRRSRIRPSSSHVCGVNVVRASRAQFVDVCATRKCARRVGAYIEPREEMLDLDARIRSHFSVSAHTAEVSA
jgi:hypothetical protein